MVRAKFFCASNTPNGGGDEGSIIKLAAVTSGGPENERFFHYTPFGELNMGTVNPAAAKEFVVGAEYYIDFTRADAGAPSQ